MTSRAQTSTTRRNFVATGTMACAYIGLTRWGLGAPPAPGSSFGEQNTDAAWPAYKAPHASGELKRRADGLWESMKSCGLCPRQCGVNRLEGASGFCRAPGIDCIVSGAHAHFGEERPLVGRGGSGTIFFSHCSLRCAFCQNWTLSHQGRGSRTALDDLASMMLRLQRDGCHNINLVTPSHYLPHSLKALDIAAGRGLKLPVVYNTCGWERMEMLEILDGIVDIYLPDFKFWDAKVAGRLAGGATSYPETTQRAILEMHRQVGVAKPAADGVMRRGLMIRHLVMPNNASGSEAVIRWIAAHLPKDTYVNIMAQYNPAYKAHDYPEISRRVSGDEYRRVVRAARDAGLTNLDARAWF